MSKITVENGLLKNVAITGIKTAQDYSLYLIYCEKPTTYEAYSHCHLVTMDQFKQALELSKVQRN